MAKTKIVIVGGVAAGASAAAKARRCDEDAEIVVFEKGPFISYANCGLPYYLSGVIPKRRQLLIVDADFFKKRFDVTVKTGHEVVGVDAARRLVTVRDLGRGVSFDEPYDKLILAPGAEAVVLPVPGADSPLVYQLKTLEDTDTLFDLLAERKPRSVVVIGAGLIGLEAVENFAARGLAVTVVAFAPQVLSFLDEEVALMVEDHLRDKGVNLRLGEAVSAIEQTAAGRARVRTAAGGAYDGDFVIMAVGVRPSTTLARMAGLELGPTGAVKVDECMRTSDPHIFAAGDCVETTHLVTGKPVHFPMAAPANKQGRAAGANAVGREIRVKGVCGTAIVKVFDLTVAVTGLSEHAAVKEGFTPEVFFIPGGHHAGYYPGSEMMIMKVVGDADSGRLLGAQIVGRAGVDKRIDVLATALYNRMAVEELIDLDLAYAPPYASARDLVIVAGALGQNRRAGDLRPVTPAALRKALDDGEEMVLVDVRTAGELRRSGRIGGAVHIPIDELRARLHELHRDRKIILYCAVGVRSYLGARILAQHGFSDVGTLTGGVVAWPYGLREE